MSPAVPGLFITGTDTEVGKTYVACQIARCLQAEGLRVGVYKPVASGCRRENDQVVSDDALALWHAAGRPGTLEAVCPQRFLAPLAPHLAARAEGAAIDRARLWQGLEPWLAQSDLILVEGAGGWFSPLDEDFLVADLAHRLGFPVVVVVRNRLGAIHQALATSFAVQRYRGGLTAVGWVLNDFSPGLPTTVPIEFDASRTSNAAELARWTGSGPADCGRPPRGALGCPLLATIEAGESAAIERVSWRRLARPPRGL